MTSNFLISSNTVVLPSEYAVEIEQDTVYILPKDASGQGGAYKAQTITDNGDGSVTITGTPAEVFEVYNSAINQNELSGVEFSSPTACFITSSFPNPQLG